jgi:hypothetical protein
MFLFIPFFLSLSSSTTPTTTTSQTEHTNQKHIHIATLRASSLNFSSFCAFFPDFCFRYVPAQKNMDAWKFPLLLLWLREVMVKWKNWGKVTKFFFNFFKKKNLKF